MRVEEKILFSTASYKFLKQNILAGGGFEEGVVEVKAFPDGERYQRVMTEVNGREVVVIGGTISDNDTLELFDLAYTLVKFGALSLTVVIPYFGYSTMERAVKIGEVVTAKSRAVLFSALPRTSMGNRIVLVDLHSEGIPHYFEGAILPVHIYCKDLVIQAAREAAGYDFVMACTDAGRAKWVESLANDMQVNAAFVFKRRVNGEKTMITSISADVENKDVVIYDDMVRTGGSLINAAKAYKEAGANRIFVITTHGLFTKDGFKQIKHSGVIEYMVCMDTHPNALLYEDEFLKVKSISSLLAEKINQF
jgi:ribose-phosphate pyrophosphokinase